MRTLLVLILALAVSTPAVAQTGLPRDTLWEKAVVVAAANAHWVPGLLVEKETTKNAGVL